MPKVSVVLGYYERPSQLKVTLDSYVHWYSGRDYEFIIVNDGSRIPITRMIEDYSKKLNIVYEEIFREVHSNPGPVYNHAVSLAKSDVIFISNPENCHLGDVLGKVEEFALPNRYLCFACATLHTIDLFSEILLNPRKYINTMDGYNGYYQHSVYSNRLLHFASAIMKDDWNRIGGFSSIYDDGCAFEDNDLVETLIKNDFEFVVFDNPMVAHIPHVRFTVEHLLEKNSKIFVKKWGFYPRESYDNIRLTIYK